MHLRYKPLLIIGSVLLYLPWATLFLGRIELFVPMIFIGLSLIPYSFLWKRLRVDKAPGLIKAEVSLTRSFRLLWLGITANAITGGIGFGLRTGFSFSYGIALLFGISLTLAGLFVSSIGIRAAKKKGADASKKDA